jgi:hypothetical protein
VKFLLIRCRNDSLARKVNKTGKKWSSQDSHILIHRCEFLAWSQKFQIDFFLSACRVDSLNMQSDTLIDWKDLSREGSGLELWGARNLYHRWANLKASVEDWKNKNHQGLPVISFHRHIDTYPSTNRHYDGPSRKIQGPSNSRYVQTCQQPWC